MDQQTAEALVAALEKQNKLAIEKLEQDAKIAERAHKDAETANKIAFYTASYGEIDGMDTQIRYELGL